MLRVSEPFSSNSVCVCVWPCVSPVPAHGLETCVMFPKGSVPAGSPSSGEKASWPPQPGRLRPVGGRGAGGCRREDVVGFTPQGSQTWRQASNADPRIKAEPPEGPALPKGGVGTLGGGAQEGPHRGLGCERPHWRRRLTRELPGTNCPRCPWISGSRRLEHAWPKSQLNAVSRRDIHYLKQQAIASWPDPSSVLGVM